MDLVLAEIEKNYEESERLFNLSDSGLNKMYEDLLDDLDGDPEEY